MPILNQESAPNVHPALGPVAIFGVLTEAPHAEEVGSRPGGTVSVLQPCTQGCSTDTGKVGALAQGASVPASNDLGVMTEKPTILDNAAGCSLRRASEILGLSYQTLKKRAYRARLGLVDGSIQPGVIDQRLTVITMASVKNALAIRRATQKFRSQK